MWYRWYAGWLGPKRPLYSPSALIALYRSAPDSLPATFSMIATLSSIVSVSGRGGETAGAAVAAGASGDATAAPPFEPGCCAADSSSPRYGKAVATPPSSAADSADQPPSASWSTSAAGSGNPSGKGDSSTPSQLWVCAPQPASYAP